MKGGWSVFSSGFIPSGGISHDSELDIRVWAEVYAIQFTSYDDGYRSMELVGQDTEIKSRAEAKIINGNLDITSVGRKLYTSGWTFLGLGTTTGVGADTQGNTSSTTSGTVEVGFADVWNMTLSASASAFGFSIAPIGFVNGYQLTNPTTIRINVVTA